MRRLSLRRASRAAAASCRRRSLRRQSSSSGGGGHGQLAAAAVSCSPVEGASSCEVAAWSSSSVAVVLVAGSFPFPAEVVEAAVGSAREVAARSSGRLVVVPAVGSFPFPVEVVVAAADLLTYLLTYLLVNLMKSTRCRLGNGRSINPRLARNPCKTPTATRRPR